MASQYVRVPAALTQMSRGIPMSRPDAFANSIHSRAYVFVRVRQLFACERVSREDCAKKEASSKKKSAHKPVTVVSPYKLSVPQEIVSEESSDPEIPQADDSKR